MIIEEPVRPGSIPEKPGFLGKLIAVFRIATTLVAILLIWFATMATITYFHELTPASMAIMMDSTDVADLPQSIQYVRNNDFTLVVTSQNPGYARTLYSKGALLVLPALRNGCLDLSTIQKDQAFSKKP